MERYQTSRSYILGSFAFIELYNRSESPFRPDSVELLMILRKNPPFANHWSLPGGGVLKNETIRDACIREVKEEVGVDVSVGAPLGIITFLGDDKRMYEAHTFKCKPLDSNFIKGEEVIKIMRVDYTNFSRDKIEKYKIAP